MAKRTVEWEGQTLKVKYDSIEIPNLANMERMAALIWVNRNTYGRGYSTKKANPLAGYAGKITIR